MRKRTPDMALLPADKRASIAVDLGADVPAGAMLATWLRQTVQRHRFVLTHRLGGTHRDGSSLSGSTSKAFRFDR